MSLKVADLTPTVATPLLLAVGEKVAVYWV